VSAGKTRRSSVQEKDIERYFVQQVEAAGGMAEKFTSPGRRGVPDRIVTWPAYGFARIHFVELKTIGGALEVAQERDHERRRRMNCFVRVLWTKKQVDEYVNESRR
jgi:hypothetical protein